MTAGVSMVVFPMWTDQFGNAARVQSFDVGVDGGDLRHVTKERITKLVTQVLGDASVHTAVAELAAGVVDRETEWQDLRAFVERHTAVAL